MAILLVSFIGYVDEGNSTLYENFGQYILGKGYPPLSDYLLWIIIGLVVGLPVFNLVSPAHSKLPYSIRVGIGVISVPIAMTVIISTIIIFSSM